MDLQTQPSNTHNKHTNNPKEGMYPGPNQSSVFWARVDIRDSGDCWLWKGSVFTKTGYGQCWYKGTNVGAHRRAFELFHNVELPGSVWVLHRCDNRLCCNPNHLFSGDAAANEADKIQKGRRPRVVGEQCHFHKLSRSEVGEIRKIGRSRTQADLAAFFGVHQSQISRILSGVIWS
jgi:HNH endonuclease